MRAIARYQYAVIFALLTISALVPPSLVASQRDEERAKTLVGSIAATVYACAWPTATYKGVYFMDLTPTSHGYEAVFRLVGSSAFDDSDLWLDIAFEFRGGSLYGTRVVRHNAILVPPFATCKALAKAVDDALRDQSPHSTPTVPSGTKAVAVCLNNKISFVMNYAYRWDSGEWKIDTISPGASRKHWWIYDSSSPVLHTFEVSYDDNLAAGVTPVQRRPVLSSTTTPIQCDNVYSYSFVLSNQSIGLASDSWQPGWPHPFAPFVVAGDKRENWRPASGYHWYDPNDNDSLRVVPNKY